jgi:hypothetical protein
MRLSIACAVLAFAGMCRYVVLYPSGYFAPSFLAYTNGRCH